MIEALLLTVAGETVPQLVLVPRASMLQRPPASACRLPTIDPSSGVIVIGAYEGAAVSTVAVADRDETTTVADISIGPKGEPLTVIVVSHDPVLYRFRGSTKRISRVIALSNRGAGVTGLPASKVTFASARGCDLPYMLYQGPSALYAPRVQQLTGKRPSYVGGTYELYRAAVGENSVSYISAPHDSDRSHIGSPEWNVLRFHPGGVAKIDPTRVVGSNEVKPYNVLPDTAGIAQLARNGVLIKATVTHVDRWATAIAAQDRYTLESIAIARHNALHGGWFVTRPTELPVGLCGAHGVTFVAPEPSYLRGDLCHSSALYFDGSSQRVPLRASSSTDR